MLLARALVIQLPSLGLIAVDTISATISHLPQASRLRPRVKSVALNYTRTLAVVTTGRYGRSTLHGTPHNNSVRLRCRRVLDAAYRLLRRLHECFAPPPPE